jgi:hypothetical protein
LQDHREIVADFFSYQKVGQGLLSTALAMSYSPSLVVQLLVKHVFWKKGIGIVMNRSGHSLLGFLQGAEWITFPFFRRSLE